LAILVTVVFVHSRERVASRANFRQAAYFRDELLRIATQLEAQIEALQITLARQGGRPELAYHVARTRSDLRAAITERNEVNRMLIALEHREPGQTHC